jgi:hypothetical protein
MVEKFVQEQNRLIYEKEGLQREIQDIRCKLNMAPHHHGIFNILVLPTKSVFKH